MLSNISGGSEQLLKALKDKIGAGGSVNADTIEVQGEHLDRVSGLPILSVQRCTEHGCSVSA